MMYRYLIFLWTLFLAACAAFNSDEVSHSKVSILDTKDLAVEEQFESEELLPIHLSAFETRAIEKLQDFSDYLGIISNFAYEEEFRRSAATLAKNLFIENSKISLAGPRSGEQRLDIFLARLGEESESEKISLANIDVAVALKETAPLLYKGTLKFDISIADKSGGPSKVSHKKADFFLMKKPKDFGSVQRKVWEICLGDIY